MSIRAPLAIAALMASGASAAPTIDPQYGDHAVLQRNAPIAFSGTAAPGEQLSLSFAGKQASATAGSDGRWRASFAPMASGIAIELTVSAPDGTAKASDLAIGDVWLCSGQSNMEYPLRRALDGDGVVQSAGDSDLRLMKVARQLSPVPNRAFETPPQWKVSSPDSAKDFSAACFFMAQHFRQSLKVPVGAIDDSWGGTPIRAWMGSEANRASGSAAAVDIADLQRTDPAAATRRFGDRWGEWWRSRTGDKPGSEPWNASERLQWKPVPSLGYWDSWSPEWKTFDGSIWARRSVTLTKAQAGQGATLTMSAIDDMDETFVNGTAVGGMSDPTNPRSYPVQKGVLHAGRNEIIVFARDVWGPGGFAGPANAFALKFDDGTAIPLSSGWDYAKIDNAVGDPPVAPWTGSSGISTIYNAMVAPLGPLPLAGVAWYQGEADVGQPGYDTRLAAFMADWRKQFGEPGLPFLIVGLAGWGMPATEPRESGWAALINEQLLATERDPRATLISAIDLGEWRDIHPANKQEVGRRLALAAQSLAYRGGGAVGPLPLGATKTAAGVEIAFSKPLQVLSGNRPVSFQLCGDTSESCRFADASVNGSKVAIADDGKPVTRVRYAWADFPIVNLYDGDLLPVPVFEIPVR